MTYLKTSSLFIFFLGTGLVVFYFGIHFFSLLVLLILFLTLFLSRKSRRLKIIEEKENGLLFTPVSGVIKKIIEVGDFTHIHIRRSFFNEWGVYMPSCGKIEEVTEVAGRRSWIFLRNSHFENLEQFSRTIVNVKSKLGMYSMHMLNSKYSRFDCWVDSGDYGFGAARLGYIKSSFNIVMIIPKDFSVVMRVSDVLTRGKSIIAANTAVHL